MQSNVIRYPVGSTTAVAKGRNTETPVTVVGHDGEDVIVRFDGRDSMRAIAEPVIAWIITKDILAGPGEEPGTNRNAVGVMGPSDISDAVQEQLLARKGRAFRMYDGDNVHYYSGRFIGDSEGEEGFAPLEDFGAPNAGCTRIDYAYPGGEWRTL